MDGRGASRQFRPQSIYSARMVNLEVGCVALRELNSVLIREYPIKHESLDNALTRNQNMGGALLSPRSRKLLYPDCISYCHDGIALKI